MFTIVASSATMSWATAMTTSAGHRVSRTEPAVGDGDAVVGVDTMAPGGKRRKLLRLLAWHWMGTLGREVEKNLPLSASLRS